MLEFRDQKAQLVDESPMKLLRVMVNKDKSEVFFFCLEFQNHSGLFSAFGKLYPQHTDSSTLNGLWEVVDLVWSYFPKRPL